MRTDEQVGSGIEIEKDLGVLGARRAVGVEWPEKRVIQLTPSETTDDGNDCSQGSQGIVRIWEA